MATGIQHLHSLLRWAVLLFGLLTLVTAMRGLNGKKDFTNGDKRTALYLLISADLQLLIGLALFFIKDWPAKFSNGMASLMSSTYDRFFAVEHTAGMLIGLILIHVGYAGTKGNRPHKAKFSRLFWCTLIAIIVIIASIPWPFRNPEIARPLFPGM